MKSVMTKVASTPQPPSKQKSQVPFFSSVHRANISVEHKLFCLFNCYFASHNLNHWIYDMHVDDYCLLLFICQAMEYIIKFIVQSRILFQR